MKIVQAVASLATVLALAGGPLSPLAPIARAEGSPSFDDFQNQKAKDIKPQDVVHWEALEATPKGKGLVEVGARMTAEQGWTIYKENLEFSGPAGYTVQDVKAPATQRIVDPISGKEVEVYAGGEFFVTLAGPTEAARDTIQLSAKYVGCTKVICLFPHTEVMFAKLLPAAPAEAPTPAASASTPTGPADATQAAIGPGTGNEVDLESQLARQLASGGLSFGALLALVFVGGLLSNLTPCVYPMIPITLRLLSRQGASAYLSASCYALGIVVTYSSLGLFAAMSGGLFGSLLASKAFNLAFAAIMLLLGVSMLGFGDFSKIQMLGNKLGAGKPSPKNAFLMGTGAGLVAAPCTGPILAALLAYTAKNNAGLAASVSLLFTYSLGFALPYLALGGAAAKVSQVKIPPAAQIGVKLLFASVMVALSMYYLRIPFYAKLEELRPLWGGIAQFGLAFGLALAAVWVCLPRLQTSKVGMIVPTAVLSVGIFGASQWLTTRGSGSHATWHKTEEAAFAAAKKAGKPVLIDMWAEWCEACKKMDASTFVDPEVTRTLEDGWVTLKLDLTEESATNEAIQQKYGLQSLPTLVLVGPDGDVARRVNITGYVPPATLLGNLAQFAETAKKAE